MKSRSFTVSRRLRRQTRNLAAQIHHIKVNRARTERRAVNLLLKAGADYVPPVVKTQNVPGFAAWDIT